jgi:hypothetical protein
VCLQIVKQESGIADGSMFVVFFLSEETLFLSVAASKAALGMQKFAMHFTKSRELCRSSRTSLNIRVLRKSNRSTLPGILRKLKEPVYEVLKEKRKRNQELADMLL